MAQTMTLSDGRTVRSDGSVYYGSTKLMGPLNSSSSGLSSGSSARSVSSRSSTSGVSDSMSSMLDAIYKITDRNTARSEAQAAELRNWQERQNQIAMDFNMAEAQKNRDWQEMMSNTAHQREVKDLQAAGLNPILSASGGNGAAVTSGATASGVTSAGAKGEVDTSASSSLVQILGSLLSAQTTLESQRINAQNNLAIAEKNNATSQLVAEMYTSQAREASILAAETGLSQSQISSMASRYVASVSAAASRYGSDISYSNALLNKEAAEITAQYHLEGVEKQAAMNFLTQGIGNVLNFVGGQLSSKRQANSALAVAEENHWNSLFGFTKNTADSITGSIGGFISDRLEKRQIRKAEKARREAERKEKYGR